MPQASRGYSARACCWIASSTDALNMITSGEREMRKTRERTGEELATVANRLVAQAAGLMPEDGGWTGLDLITVTAAFVSQMARATRSPEEFIRQVEGR